MQTVNAFTYLGHKVSYEEEKDIMWKISKFLQVLGMLNNILKPKLVQKQSWLKVFNILAIPSLLCDFEIWTLKQRDIRRLKAADMKFIKWTAGYNVLDHTRNEDVVEE